MRIEFLKEELSKLDHENFLHQKVSGEGKSCFDLNVYIETSPGIFSDFVCEYHIGLGVVLRAR